jgi:hypothetical protein
MLILKFFVLFKFKLALLQPRNFNRIRQENFQKFWNQFEISEDSAWLVHMDIKSITASLLVDGILENFQDLLLVEDCIRLTSFDYIYADRIFMWVDFGSITNTISASINFYSNKNPKIESWRFDLPDDGRVNSIAVDWISKNIYWSESDRDFINVCNLYGSDCRPIISTLYQITKNIQGRLKFS